FDQTSKRKRRNECWTPELNSADITAVTLLLHNSMNEPDQSQFSSVVSVKNFADCSYIPAARDHAGIRQRGTAYSDVTIQYLVSKPGNSTIQPTRCQNPVLPCNLNSGPKILTTSVFRFQQFS